MILLAALFALFLIVFMVLGIGLLNRVQLLIDRVDSAAGVFADIRDDLEKKKP